MKKFPIMFHGFFISRDVMVDNKAKFTAVIEFEPEQSHDVKFRASIIEQHKEVESDQLFAKFSALKSSL